MTEETTPQLNHFLLVKGKGWCVGRFATEGEANAEAKKHKDKFYVVATLQELEQQPENELKAIVAFFSEQDVEQVTGGNYAERAWTFINSFWEYPTYDDQVKMQAKTAKLRKNLKSKPKVENETENQEANMAKKVTKKKTAAKKKTASAKTTKRVPGKKTGAAKKKAAARKSKTGDTAAPAATKKKAKAAPSGKGFKGFREGTMKEKACKFFFEKKPDRQAFIDHTVKLGASAATASSWYGIFSKL